MGYNLFRNPNIKLEIDLFFIKNQGVVAVCEVNTKKNSYDNFVHFLVNRNSVYN
jgi:hypothetical protein